MLVVVLKHMELLRNSDCITYLIKQGRPHNSSYYKGVCVTRKNELLKMT
jgi:hypothetical protein